MLTPQVLSCYEHDTYTSNLVKHSTFLPYLQACMSLQHLRLCVLQEKLYQNIDLSYIKTAKNDLGFYHLKLPATVSQHLLVYPENSFLATIHFHQLIGIQNEPKKPNHYLVKSYIWKSDFHQCNHQDQRKE